MPEPPKVWVKEKIQSSQKDPARSITCNPDNISIKDGAQTYTLNLSNPAKDYALMKKPDGIAFGNVNRISYDIINQNDGSVVTSNAVICGDNSIQFGIGDDNIYHLELSGASDGSILMKQGNKIIFNSLSEISKSTIVDQTVTEDSSMIMCTNNSIVLSVGNNSYSLKLEGGNDLQPLVKMGNELIFNDLYRIARVITTIGSNGSETTKEISMTALSDSIVLRIGDNLYALRLEDGEEGAPLVVKGEHTIGFGTPPIDRTATIILTPNLPPVAEAEDNTLYFLYNENNPYVPPESQNE